LPVGDDIEEVAEEAAEEERKGLTMKKLKRKLRHLGNS